MPETINVKDLRKIRKRILRYDKLLFKKVRMIKILGYRIFYYKNKNARIN